MTVYNLSSEAWTSFCSPCSPLVFVKSIWLFVITQTRHFSQYVKNSSFYGFKASLSLDLWFLSFHIDCLFFPFRPSHSVIIHYPSIILPLSFHYPSILHFLCFLSQSVTLHPPPYTPTLLYNTLRLPMLAILNLQGTVLENMSLSCI